MTKRKLKNKDVHKIKTKDPQISYKIKNKKSKPPKVDKNKFKTLKLPKVNKNF
jgi:hypothetical protein